MLSMIVPVFNEERYVGEVLDALLAKELSDHRRRSSSSRATAPTARARSCASYEGTPGRHASSSRTSRAARATPCGGLARHGTIVLIQDADFEYDLDDYDALLEPILQRRTSFVLGSAEPRPRRLEGAASTRPRGRRAS